MYNYSSILLPNTLAVSYSSIPRSKIHLPQVNQILQKVWKAKTLPPFLKTFAWRLIRRALATAHKAGRFSTNIDQTCNYCGSIETENHLFFLCALPMEIWTNHTTPLSVHLLDSQEDGVQMSLHLLITTNPSEETLSHFLFTLWYYLESQK
jgi:hypothetical protein